MKVMAVVWVGVMTLLFDALKDILKDAVKAALLKGLKRLKAKVAALVRAREKGG